MAYITKEEVQEKTAKLKAIAKRYGITLSVSGSNSSTITVTIRKGKLDFIGNYMENKDDPSMDFFVKEQKAPNYLDVNPYWYQEHYTGFVLECLNEIHAVLREGHYDHSDIMTDYFHCAWYLYVKIGTWNKPYILEK
jgi:hypothetical protein